MTSLLVKNAAILVTMDDHRREIPGGGLFIRDGFIEQVGPTGELPRDADEVLDLSDHIVLPGLDQHPPPLLPDADPGGSGSAGCQPVQLAENALPDLGAHDAGRYPHLHPDCPGRAGALRLHHSLRPPVPLPERLAAG